MSSHFTNISTPRFIPAFMRRRFARWLKQRLPAAQRIRLNQKRLFILPSKAGFGFLFLLMLMWLMATNYQNSLVFAVVCLLSSLFVTAILHSYANLAGLELSFVGAEPVFAGQKMFFRIALHRVDTRTRQGIRLCFAGVGQEHHQLASLMDQDGQEVLVPAASTNRGWLQPGCITVESYYPLGLLRVWTYLDLDCQGLVYPRPTMSITANAVPAQGETGQTQTAVGSDDFAGFKHYQPGAPLQHVSWKHYARERGLLSKQYADAIEERFWLDWRDYPGLDREARLSRLCGRLLAISEQCTEYGLKLPGVEVPLGRGERHKRQILRHLALFELTRVDGDKS